MTDHNTSSSNLNSSRGKKRGSTEETNTLRGKKRKVEQVNSQVRKLSKTLNQLVSLQEQTADGLNSPRQSPPLQRRRQQKCQRMNIDAVPAVDEQAAARRRARQNEERDLRWQARTKKKEEMERERVRQLKAEERRQYEAEMASEFYKISERVRTFANSSLDTSTLSPLQRQMFEAMKAITTDSFISEGSYTNEGAEGEPEMCSICLEVFEEDEGVSYFNGCSHLFHHECLHEWLMRNDSCPNCRNPTANFQPRQ
jgi:hypothetical protein